MQKDYITRPTIYGPGNHQQYLTLPSEITIRTLNVNGFVHLVARGKVGKVITDSDWQLQRFIYDATGAVTAVIWPLFDSKPTADYLFQYGPENAAVVTAISQANPAVITANNTFTNGEQVYFDNVLGMTQVNFTGNNLYTVSNATATSFQLLGVDSTNFGSYTSGGIAHVLPALQYGFG